MRRLGLIGLMVLAGAAQAQPAVKAPAPKLIVAISVDQYSADLFAEYRSTYTQGMKRLANAIVFPSGYQSHAATETCPGHSTILTGSHPARTGVIANEWIDWGVTRGKGDHSVYCAEDESVPGSTMADYTVSPVHLRVPTMGDRLKAADPRSRVVAVAGKDRAAVMMGGHMTDAIWFLDTKTAKSYVTLPGRDQTPPPVVAEVNGRVAAFIARPLATPLPPQCAARVSALRLSDDVTVGVPDPKPNLRVSPEFDRATADIAIGLIRQLQLGKGPATDLIAIGLSATDYVGHRYGTEGPEMCAQMANLDVQVGRILAALDANGAPYAVVLTADHGGLDVPERAASRGAPEAARVAINLADIAKPVVEAFKLDIDPKLLLAGAVQGDVYLNTAVPPALRPQVLAAVKARFLALPQVAEVLTADEIAHVSAPQPPVEEWTLADRARASFDRPRSGDLLVFLKPRTIALGIRAGGNTATHGSPWDYDRRVPILFWYPGAVPHEMPLSVETVDILPTLAPLVGLAVPAAEIDGRCLDLDPGPGTTCRR